MLIPVGAAFSKIIVKRESKDVPLLGIFPEKSFWRVLKSEGKLTF